MPLSPPIPSLPGLRRVRQSLMFALAAIGLAALAMPAPAEAHDTGRHHHHHRKDRLHRDAMPRLPAINVLPGIGTYSGSITVYRVAGIGTSTWLEGRRTRVVVREPVSMKLITIDAAKADQACSMEQGVCVIRP